MIYDVLENLEQYTGLFEYLDTALTFLAETDLDALPQGRTDIDGDNVYLTVQNATAAASDARPFETHENYMDIHIDLAGTELFEVAAEVGEELTPYDEATDTATYKGDLSCACVLGPGRFIITMTQEPHKSLVASADGPQVKKLVVKVRR